MLVREMAGLGAGGAGGVGEVAALGVAVPLARRLGGGGGGIT